MRPKVRLATRFAVVGVLLTVGACSGITQVAPATRPSPSATAPSAADCSDVLAPGVGLDPLSIATALKNRPGLTVTKTAASVGGLTGWVLDIRFTSGWSKGCPGPVSGVMVPLIMGTNGYDQMIGGRTLIRLYLLALPGSAGTPPATLGIEVDDQTGGSHIEKLSSIANEFEFQP